MEIEKKFTIKTLPQNLSSYPYVSIEQGYLCTEPVVRIRKKNDDYILTYKGKGMLAREEHEMPLTKESYSHLKQKCDGNIISKKRYLIPLDNPKFSASCPKELLPKKLLIELDIFDAPFSSLILAEVEFDSLDAANAFIAPDWFLEEVTNNPQYHNSNMSQTRF